MDKRFNFNFNKPSNTKSINDTKSKPITAGINIDEIIEEDKSEPITPSCGFIKDKIDNIIKDYNKVLPVTIDLNLEIINRTFNNDYEEWSINRDIISNHKYSIIGNKLYDCLYKFSKHTIRLTCYIAKTIEYNSNTIVLDFNVLGSRLAMHKRIFYSAIAELCNNNILFKTTKTATYSVNPLYIFKGSLIKFYKLYYDKYGDKSVKVDSRNRIVLIDENYNSNVVC